MGTVVKIKGFKVQWLSILIFLFCSSVVYAITELSSIDQQILGLHKDYVLLSSDVYGFESVLKENPKANVEGRTIVHSDSRWKVLDYTDNSKFSGFTAATFQNEETGVVVVAYGGTTAGEDDKLDRAACLAIAEGDSRSPQFTEALAYILKAQKQYPDAIIEITGHSLGGGLATWAGLKTGLTTVTINTSPIPVSKYAYSFLGPDGRYRLANSELQGNITHIRSVDDPVSYARDIQDWRGYNTSVGETISLDSWRGTAGDSKLNPYFVPFGWATKLVDAHKMSPLLKEAFPSEPEGLVFADSDSTLQSLIGAKADVGNGPTTGVGSLDMAMLSNSEINPPQGEDAGTSLFPDEGAIEDPVLHQPDKIVYPKLHKQPKLHEQPKLYSPM